MNTPQDYIDLDIHIFERQGDRYRVDLSVYAPRYGPVSGYLDGNQLYEDMDGTRRLILSASPKDNSQRLYQLLFNQENLRQAWTDIRSAHALRRVRLLIDPSAPELHAIPWELLPEVDLAADDQVLGASEATPYSRYLAGGWQPAAAVQALPLKILVAVADPQNLKKDHNLDPIEVDSAWAGVQQATSALASSRQLELNLLEAPCSLPRLEEELKRGYHVLHLVCHGKFSHKSQQTALYLADQDNQVKQVRDNEIAGMLDRQLKGAPGDGKLRLLVLASCETGMRAVADVTAGLVPRLITAGLPAVLAMQEEVGEETASIFTQTFYRQLVTHGLVDLACNEARSRLLSHKLADAYVPVLYSRLNDNQLLEAAKIKPPITRLEFEPEIVFIRSGEFYMGGAPGDPEADAWELPGGWIDLPAYCIGKYPVTNREYQAFVLTANHNAPGTNWIGRKIQDKKENYPVVDVSCDDAQAYCKWLSVQTGRRYRLPSEAEWEKAARGMQDQRIYPWGEAWKEKRCHHAPNGGQLAARNAFPAQSPFEVYDLVGNAREWTSTLWGSDSSEDQTDFPYPWRTDGRDKQESTGNFKKVFRIHRGGAYDEPRASLRCSGRAWDAPDTRRATLGFRVLMEIT